jgi:hypothetical protein
MSPRAAVMHMRILTHRVLGRTGLPAAMKERTVNHYDEPI